MDPKKKSFNFNARYMQRYRQEHPEQAEKWRTASEIRHLQKNGYAVCYTVTKSATSRRETKKNPETMTAEELQAEIDRMEAQDRRTAELRAESTRRWQERNKEHLREYRRKWRAKNRKKLREYSRKWHREHPGKRKEYQDRWATNREKRLQMYRDALKKLNGTDSHNTQEGGNGNGE